MAYRQNNNYGGNRPGGRYVKQKGSYSNNDSQAKFKTMADNQLVVYRNPFSTATTNPKIPDGKVLQSCGIRLQAVNEFTNNVSPHMQFVIYPGLMNGVSYIDWEPNVALVPAAVPVNAGVNPDTPPDRRLITRGDMKYSNLTSFASSVPVANGAVDFPAATWNVDYTQQNESSTLTQWRVVSQGVRLSLTNNSDENDGWFEAIRMPTKRNPEYFEVRQPTGPGGPYGVVVPDPTIPWIANRNLVEHPSYVTGKIRDMHRYLFQLKPQNSDHEFIPLEKKYKNIPTGRAKTEMLAAAGNADGVAAWNNNYDSLKDYLTSQLDDSFDCILIRLHARPMGPLPPVVPANPGAIYVPTPTRIMVHSVTNMEVVFDDAGFLSRFHTECKSTSKFAGAKKLMSESRMNAAVKLKATAM